MDEIRSIEDPDYYFKYFLTKNERWNERQRFAFNGQSASHPRDPSPAIQSNPTTPSSAETKPQS
jgi:hypothetical protein